MSNLGYRSVFGYWEIVKCNNIFHGIFFLEIPFLSFPPFLVRYVNLGRVILLVIDKKTIIHEFAIMVFYADNILMDYFINHVVFKIGLILPNIQQS